jgi:O-antigen ligase
MIFLSAIQIKKAFLPQYIWRSPLIWTIIIYILWMLLSAITSSHPIVSFKFILARLWFIVPVLFFGTYFFQRRSNRIEFIWLFIVATVLVIIYTLIHHSFYGFGEKEGHWVMSPFFKDHTIYGAIVALVLPLAVGLYFYKKHNPLVQMTLISLIVIILIGLVLSYTRAAWLSVLGSVGLAVVLYYKISWKPIAVLVGVGLIAVFIHWDQIQMELERNKYEHTTEAFDERLQSAANISTDASNLERINRWSCAIAMFKERPIMGYGPGTYAFEYAPFQRPENLTIISTNFGDMGNAHSEYLGALAETGLIGMLSLIAVVAAIFFTGITLYHRLPKENKEDRIIVLSTIMALSTYFIHAFLNNYLDTDKAAVPIWGICAMWLVYESELSLSGQSKEKG